jgi:hypothetical protein
MIVGSEQQPQGQDGIVVCEVIEIFDDDDVPPIVEECSVASEKADNGQLQEDTIDTNSLNIGEVIALFHRGDGASAGVAIETSSRYSKNKIMKKFDSKYVQEEKIKPSKPTAICKYFLRATQPSQDPVVDFLNFSIDKETKKTKNHRDKVPEEPEEEINHLPCSFQEYMDDRDKMCNMILSGQISYDGKPNLSSFEGIDKYKRKLIACIDYELYSQIASAKELLISDEQKSNEYQGIISEFDSNQKENKSYISIDVSHPPGNFGISFGQKVLVVIKLGRRRDQVKRFCNVNGMDVKEVDNESGEITHVLHMYFIPFTSESLLNKKCSIRGLCHVNHLFLEAKTVFSLENHRLHQDFVNPLLKSVASGIDCHFSSNFKDRYDQNSFFFYRDCIQKIMDTVAINQDDISRICVIDDHRISKLKYLVVDAVKYIIQHQKEMSEDTTAKFQILVTGADEEILSTTARNLCHITTVYHVSPKSCIPSPSTIHKNLVRLTEQLRDDDENKNACKDLLESIAKDKNFMSVARFRFEEEIRYKLLTDAQVLVGNPKHLFNDLLTNRLLEEKTFDVAVVHDSSRFKEYELVSLQLFDIKKLILLNVMGRECQDDYGVIQKLVRKFESHPERKTLGASSSVVSEFSEDETSKPDFNFQRPWHFNQHYQGRSSVSRPFHRNERGRGSHEDNQRRDNNWRGLPRGRRGHNNSFRRPNEYSNFPEGRRPWESKRPT